MPDYAPLRNLLTEAGYTFVDPPIIHDASVFVDLAGEDLRRRLYLTSDNEGNELALRPDFTIPVCLRHLARGAHQRREDYAYLGPVFRQRGAVPGEFLQAGVESLGRTDRVAADAQLLRLALDAAACVNMRRPKVLIGDSAIFHAFVDALKIPKPWHRRLTRMFGDPPRLAEVLETARNGAQAAGAPRLASASRAKARDTAERMLRESGLATIGGRQADEIARRYADKAALRTGIGDRAADVLGDYLAIQDGPKAALAQALDLARAHRLDLGTAADRFAKRLDAFAKQDVPMDNVVFAAKFGRRLDYYTGFNFEIYARLRDTRPTIGGGRYDRLLSMLGAEKAVPAIGFAIWLERTGAPA